MVVMHESGTISLQRFFNLIACGDESGNDFSHVFTGEGWLGSVTLHTNDSQVIFFSNPDEQVIVVVVEDTSAIWPMSSHS